MWDRIHRQWKPIGRFGKGAAWFFIIVSLAHLGWVIATKWSEPGNWTTLYQTDVGGEVHRAWGLAYYGVGGLLLAMAQAALVTTAAVMSVLPWPRGRRLGHGILVLWSAFWALSLFRLAALDHALDSILQTTLLLALFACTVHRAIDGWTPRAPDHGAPSKGAGAPPMADEPALEPTTDDAPEPRLRRVVRSLRERVQRTTTGTAGRMRRRAREASAAALTRAGDSAHRLARRLTRAAE